MKTMTLLGCALAIAALSAGPAIAQESRGIAVGDPMPDFKLKSLEGKEMGPAQYRGKPVLLIFGASW